MKADDFACMADIIDQLDYVISIGTAIEKNLVEQLHARGAKVISYKGGNGAVMGGNGGNGGPAGLIGAGGNGGNAGLGTTPGTPGDGGAGGLLLGFPGNNGLT